MSTLIPEITLPDGMKIFCLREEEVSILYGQIQEYLRNGIELHEGDTVFDVGANIGLFTLWVNQLCNQNVNVYAFEPIPALFEVLQCNAQRFDTEKLKVFPCGLSQQSKQAIFTYHPNATALSTAYPDNSKQERNKFKNAILSNLENGPNSIRWIRWLPPFLRSLILDKKLEAAFQTEEVLCQLRTLSEIIQEYEVQQIDLLKVDVEKSELDVLLGVKEEDWLKIKQVVVEVHDLQSRVETIRNLLKEHGFNKIAIEQESVFKGSDIFNIYALRSHSE